jgi:hypothetical protein
MGYQDVRFHGGGILEQGKDIVMWSDEPVRGRVNVAVVVKAEPITGKMATGDVVNQLREAFGKQYLDLAKAEPITIHECFVVTPQAITKEGSYALEGLLQNEPFRRHVEYVDGDRLWQFVEQYLTARVLLPRLSATYRDIQRVAPDLGIELKGETLVIRPRQPRAEAVIVTPTFSDTSEGRANQEAFEHFLKTGEPTDLPASSFTGLSLPESLSILGLDAGSGMVRVGASRRLDGALTLQSSSSAVTFEHIEFVVRGGSQKIHLTNAAQGIPFVLDLTIKSTEDGVLVGHTSYSSRVEGWSAQWLDKQQRALRIMAAGCSFVFSEHQSGIDHSLGVVSAGLVKTSSEEFQELVGVLAWVEQQLKQPIPVPVRAFFTEEDRENLDFVRTIIKTGQAPISSAAFTLTPVPGRREVLSKAIRAGKASGLLTGDTSAWRVLDTRVQLGPFELHGVGARLLTEQPIESAMAAIERGEDVPVRVEPADGKRLFVRYTRWYKMRRR